MTTTKGGINTHAVGFGSVAFMVLGPVSGRPRR